MLQPFHYRDYQIEAIQSVFDYFEAGNVGNPVVAMPTGTGKSPVIGGLCHRILTTFSNQRIIIASHVKEILEQDYKAIKKCWPFAPVGIYSSGLNQKDIAQPIIIGGVQSLVNVVEAFGHRDLLIIDEAHLLSPKEDSMYQNIIKRLKIINPYLKVIGLTATPYRLGQGLITDDGLFTDIICDMTTLERFNQFIYEGYLSPLIPLRTNTEYDLSEVSLNNGDFAKNELQATVDKKEITLKILQEAIPQGLNRQSWLVFASGVEHSEHVAEMLNLMGISAAAIHSKTNKEERALKLETHKQGLIRCLVSNNVLTTGYDNPNIDFIIMLRPTMSPGLWVQMLGRGTRPVYASGYDLTTLTGRLAAIAAGSKQNCLVLDFAGNSRRLGPINDPLKPKNKKKVCDNCGTNNHKFAKNCIKCGSELASGDAPIKICPVSSCNAYNHASARSCCNCGHVFEIKNKLVNHASTIELIKEYEAPVIEWYDVNKVLYTRHIKAGSKDSIKISYFSGLLMFNEWISLEHPKPAVRKFARDWWRMRYNPQDDPPTTTDEALYKINNGIFRTPVKIRVYVNKKYPEILSHQFAD